MPDSILSVGVSVPTYTNVEMLRRCLLTCRTHLPEDTPMVVVDDSGNGSTVAALHAEFPAVTWIVHERNLGFGPSANEAVMSNPADVVILLNDDVELLSSPVESLRRAFADHSFFAVTFRSLNENGEFREGAKRLVWRLGYPKILHNVRDQAVPHDGLQASSYAVGGHAAFLRETFAALGGFDPLFEPFYWEDVDLSVRAAQQGWTCVYLPDCAVRHAGPSSIRESQLSRFIRQTTLRNRILFAWRHATPAQRKWLGFSLWWQRLMGDRTFQDAYRSAHERWKSFSTQTGESTREAQATGVPLGDKRAR